MATNEALDVLLVEDSETDAELVVRELQGSGFASRWSRVETRSDLEAQLRGRRWDIVISDSAIPGMSMLETLDVVRAIAPSVPVIVVSGSITAEVAVQALRAGAVDYLTKEELARLGLVIRRELAARRPDQVALSSKLIAAQEAERRRIARDLHDEVGQLLVALGLTLETTRQAPPSQHDQLLADAIDLVERAVQQTRECAFELSPSVLDDHGLAAALRWCADEVTRWSRLDIEIECADMARPSPEVELACFRISQEALTNIARHADARSVVIRWTEVDGVLQLEIRDDGAGFFPDDAWQRAGRGESLGMLGMRERALVAGGRLEVTSSPGAGTSVRARFPRQAP